MIELFPHIPPGTKLRASPLRSGVNARAALAAGNAVLHTGAMVCFRTVWLGLLGAALGGCTVSESPRELGVWVAEGVSLVNGALVVPTDDVIGWSPLEGVLPVGRPPSQRLPLQRLQRTLHVRDVHLHGAARIELAQLLGVCGE